MGIQPIHQIKAGDIISPEQGRTPLYVTGFERDAKNTIISVLGHPILESDRAYSGSKAIPIASDDLQSGSLYDMRMQNPMVIISRDTLTKVKVDSNAYFATYYASASPALKQEIANAETDMQLNKQRVVDIEISSLVRPRNYEGYLQTTTGFYDDNIAEDIDKKRTNKKRGTAVSYTLDMYLETAVTNGILPKHLYDVFAKDSKSFTTLNDVFNGLSQGDLNRYVDVENNRSLPAVYSHPPEDGDAFMAEISRRENLLDSDPVVLSARNISLEHALNKGWIEQRTYDVLTQQEDPEGNMNCGTLYEAFQTIGAHAYYFEEFKNPDSGYKLGKNIRADIISDVEQAYKSLTKDTKIAEFNAEIKAVRANFSSYALAGGQDVLRVPDMTQHYTAKVKKKAANELAGIVSNRPETLLSPTPPA